jgi:cell division protein ZipA
LDIKDFILIGGGILIATVVGHGFWIAWRAKREPLRMDIVPDLIPDDIDEMERLRGELPNGGARVVNRSLESPDPRNLELDLEAPVLVETAAEPPQPERAQQEIPQKSAPNQAPFDRPKKLRARVHQAPMQPQEPLLNPAGAEAGNAKAPIKPGVAATEPLVAARPQVKEVELSTPRLRVDKRRKRAVATPETAAAPADPAPVEELLIINVLAPKGHRFEGESLVTALRNQGLRYGDMNIFHRVEPATKAKLYSVANAVEPGTFDLSDLNTMRSPGMTFFLQLPAPGDAVDVFSDMLQAARNVALELGGELRDEDLSVMTGQTAEHMRQRIADFARRRLSKRA